MDAKDQTELIIKYRKMSNKQLREELKQKDILLPAEHYAT